MTLLILLGLLNGVAVSLSRTLNGRLASARGAMTASLANHLLGFGLLGALACALLIVTGQLAGGALLDALAGRLAASDLLGILLVLAGAALQRWQAGKPRS
ncbi:DMT family transporter [Aeromonas media]|uniref:DMT family transporter n=1 Tax=Aeromonas media TaxID=651 RepID=UPI0038D1FDA6